MSVRTERIDDRLCHLVHGRLLVEKRLFLGIGDETHLKQYRRTSGLEQHPERRLTHAAVLAVEVPDEAVLYLRSKLQRLVHVTVLHQFEHDIRVNRIRVKTLVGRFVVRLQFHHRVLTHRHVQVRLHLLRSENERLHAAGSFGLRRIGMNRDEQVGIRFVGDVGAGLQRDEHIGGTGINHLHIGILLFEQLTDFEHQTQVEVFLFGHLTDSSRVLTAVSGIQHHGITRLCHQRQRAKEYQ